VEFLVLLNIDLVEELLPVVVEVEEELFVVDHLGLSVEEHGSGLTEVLTSVQEVAHSVVMETSRTSSKMFTPFTITLSFASNRSCFGCKNASAILWIYS